MSTKSIIKTERVLVGKEKELNGALFDLEFQNKVMSQKRLVSCRDRMTESTDVKKARWY